MSQESNYKHYTRGGQISFHHLRMWDQITKTLLYGCFGIWILCSGFFTWWLSGSDKLLQTAIYYMAEILALVPMPHTFDIPHQGRILKRSVHDIIHNPYYSQNADRCFDALMIATLIAAGIALIFGCLLTYYFIRKGKVQTSNKFIRGATLVPHEILKKQITKRDLASDLHIDGFPLIKDCEVQHLLVHGTVGMGKSQLIMKLMDVLRKRGDRVIVYDKGCTFTESYFQPLTDVLLNPFDARCANWDLWAEAPRDELLENMAESLIPMHGESDPFWVNAARTVLSSAASKMRHDKERSIEKLLQLLVTGEFKDLEPYLSGTAAATLVSQQIEKTAISIRSVITTYLKSMQSLSGLNEADIAPFSIRDYILNPENNGWLFISSNGEQHKSLRPLISMWIAMASLTLLSLPENQNRRIWFICDELPSLHKLPLLGETIAEVRKFGGCFLLGMQSFSQLVKVYGQSGAAEIFDLLNTRAFFASPSHEMAQMVSKELGEEEVDDTRENYSYGANSIRDGISLGKNRVTRPLVTYPEIMGLEALECFLRLPGHPVTKLKLKHQKRPSNTAGFIARELNAPHAELIAAPHSSTSESEAPEGRIDNNVPKKSNHAFAMESMFESRS